MDRVKIYIAVQKNVCRSTKVIYTVQVLVKEVHKSNNMVRGRAAQRWVRGSIDI
jgi:hypothetical protein